MKTCTICTKTGVEFPAKGLICKACLAAKRRSKRAVETAETRQESMRALVTTLRQDKIDVPHISELCAELIRQQGGVVAFAKTWKQDIDDARAVKPGSKTVLDADYAIAKLIVASTVNRASADDMANLSDEDLSRLIGHIVADQKPLGIAPETIEEEPPHAA